MISDGLQKQRRVCGEDHGDVLVTLGYLAELYQDSKRPDEALPLLQRVHATRTRTLGRSNLKTIQAANALAMVLVELNRGQEAVRIYRDVSRKLERSTAASSPLLIALLSNLGIVHRSLGDHKEAEDYLAQAVERAELLLDKDDPRLLKLLANYAMALSQNSKSGEAERILARCHHAILDNPEGTLRLPTIARQPWRPASELHQGWNLGASRELFLDFGLDT